MRMRQRRNRSAHHLAKMIADPRFIVLDHLTHLDAEADHLEKRPHRLGRWPQGSAPSDGRLEGGYRDGAGVFPGHADPLLVVSDGAPGIIRAIEECFPRSARQRCLAHRMRNLAVKVPTDLWPEFKTRVAACYQAPSRAIARELATGIRSDYAATLPSAVSCFEDDFEACIALRG